MHTTTKLMLATIALIGQAANAQPVPAPQAGVGITSSPGKAAAVAAVEVTAIVTAIDKGTRTITLKGPEGRSLDVVAGDEVKNFDQIRLGDNVVMQYLEALTLDLKKSKSTLSANESSAVVRAKPGERPAGAVGREIVALVDVVAVDPVKSTISLKGPRGNVVVLKVQNQEHFKVVKVGDQVEAVYTEAVAIAVKPAPKAAAKK